MLALSVWTLASLALAADIKVTDAEGERLHVYVNGDEKGKTPMTVKLPVGKHIVSVKEVPYLAAELEYAIEVTDEAARGDLEFSWEYERAKFAWAGSEEQLVIGEAVAGDGGASGVRAGHQSSSSVDRVAGSSGGSTSTTGGTTSASGSTSSSGSTGSSGSTSTSGGSSSGGSTSTSGGSSSGGSTSSDGGATSSSGGASSDGSSATADGGGATSTDGGSASSSGGATSSGGSASSGGATASSGGSSSSGGSASGGGNDGVAAIDPGGFDPTAKPVKIVVPPFYPDFGITLRSLNGEVGVDFGGEELQLPEGPNEVTVILGDQDLSYPVFIAEGATLPLPWGLEVDDGEGGIQRFLYGPEDAPPEQDFRITLPDPVDYPVQVKAYLTPSPGVLQRYEIDPMLHPAFSAYDDFQDTVAPKQKATKVVGAIAGAGAGALVLAPVTWLYANKVNDQARATTDPQEFEQLSDRATYLLYGANGLAAVGIALPVGAIIYRFTAGKKPFDNYAEAEQAYKEAKRDTVPLDSIAE